MTPERSSIVAAILRSGLIVGVMDAIAAMTHAFVLRGTAPERVWRYVASGALGKAAAEGGIEMVFAGLLFHFAIATGWTALFFLIAAKLPFLASHRINAGIGYGLFIWVVMNYVVVPMSRIPTVAVRPTVPTLFMILIHMFVIGVPISWMAQRHYVRDRAGQASK